MTKLTVKLDSLLPRLLTVKLPWLRSSFVTVWDINSQNTAVKLLYRQTKRAVHHGRSLISGVDWLSDGGS
jgi:hypothetical protein